MDSLFHRLWLVFLWRLVNISAYCLPSLHSPLCCIDLSVQPLHTASVVGRWSIMEFNTFQKSWLVVVRRGGINYQAARLQDTGERFPTELVTVFGVKITAAGVKLAAWMKTVAKTGEILFGDREGRKQQRMHRCGGGGLKYLWAAVTLPASCILCRTSAQVTGRTSHESISSENSRWTGGILNVESGWNKWALNWAAGSAVIHLTLHSSKNHIQAQKYH